MIITRRICAKCQDGIPYYKTINGKRYCFKNRKYCLICSPYKNRIKKTGRGNYQNSQKHKDVIVLSLYKRGLERKIFFINQKGGKCQRCGYCKSRRALHFHHRNPKEKLLNLCINVLWAKKIELLQEEVNKCDLLCANCHAEMEDETKRIDGTSIVDKVNKKYKTNY